MLRKILSSKGWSRLYHEDKIIIWFFVTWVITCLSFLIWVTKGL